MEEPKEIYTSKAEILSVSHVPGTRLLLMRTAKCVTVLDASTGSNEMVLLGSNWSSEKSELNHFYSKELNSLIVVSNEGKTIFSYKSVEGDLPFKEKPKRYNLGSERIIRTYPDHNLVKLASGDLFEISALLSNGDPFLSEFDNEVVDIVSDLSLKPNVLPNQVLDDKFFFVWSTKLAQSFGFKLYANSRVHDQRHQSDLLLR